MVRERLRPGPESPRARPLHLCTEINPSAAPAPGALAVPASLPRSGEKDDNFRNRSVWARNAGGVEKSKYFTVRASMKKTEKGGSQILSLSRGHTHSRVESGLECEIAPTAPANATSSLVVRSAFDIMSTARPSIRGIPCRMDFLDLGKNGE